MGFLNRLTIDGNTSNVKNYTAGTGINISENGVISATGVGAIDTSLSTVSTNPVQNRVITNALNGKQEKLVAGSNITINGNVISASGGGGTIDPALSTTSTNPVENRAVTQRINSIEGSITNINTQIADKQDKLTAGANITISGNVISATGGSVTVDSALSTTSTNPVENRAITTEINGIKTNVATAQNDISDLDTRVQALEDGGECIDYSLDGSYASGNLTLTLSDGTTSQSTNIDLSALGEPFRVKNWEDSGLTKTIPVCTSDIANTSIDSFDFSITGQEATDYQIVGMVAYQVTDSSSTRINCWPVCQFTGNNQTTLRVRMMCAGTTDKTAARISAWVLLKHR